MSYDAIVLVSFGGPERAEDVLPFLRRVTAGRPIPEDRLTAVAEHYYARGGRSPLPDQCRDLRDALAAELRRRGHDIEVFWGNRNWHPLLTDLIPELAADGHRRLLMLTTSAYPSYSGCRQYRENMAAAAAGTEVEIDRIDHYALDRGFVQPNFEAVHEAWTGLGADSGNRRLVFVTHSIPEAMADASGGPGRRAYVDWHRQVADRIVRALEERTGRPVVWELAYCSRSGPPQQPWLGPDINDLLTLLAEERVEEVVLSPIGFTSDHMEVVWDLDTEAAAAAAAVGIRLVRAGTAGTHPVFVSGLVDRIEARIAGEAAGEPGPRCAANCCPNPYRPATPAVAERPAD
ncbi:ferrochelatase [Granulicoccus phenolivorans]|uniref:ferrochelatase n=1 Tax=Granulicoccus phenolivorans TaxID=266854 RepID=UPI0005598A92|nr:ferrochelatase [Granulicoccus phenolivorans]